MIPEQNPYPGLTVLPFGNETLRFEVVSESGKGSYFVDLSCYGGVGKCDCPDFEKRKEPLLNKIPNPSPEQEQCKKLRCKHLMRAAFHLANLVIAQVREQERQARKR